MLQKYLKSWRRSLVLSTKSGSLHHPVMPSIGLQEWSRGYRMRIRPTWTTSPIGACWMFRSDIAYAVGLLSRISSKPTLTTRHLITYLIQCVCGIVSKGIQFSGSMLDMHIFTDADWAGDILTRRSTTGYVVFAACGSLSWQSKRYQHPACRASIKSSTLVCRKSFGFGGCCPHCNFGLANPICFSCTA